MKTSSLSFPCDSLAWIWRTWRRWRRMQVWGTGAWGGWQVTLQGWNLVVTQGSDLAKMHTVILFKYLDLVSKYSNVPKLIIPAVVGRCLTLTLAVGLH